MVRHMRIALDPLNPNYVKLNSIRVFITLGGCVWSGSTVSLRASLGERGVAGRAEEGTGNQNLPRRELGSPRDERREWRPRTSAYESTFCLFGISTV